MPPRAPADPVAGLADLLVRGLTALAEAGETDAACRLAGQACALLRTGEPKEWRKFNVLLHRLTPRLPPDEGERRPGG